MKLIVVMLTACLIQVSATTVAQKINYSKKDGTLEQLFTAITKQTGYFVVYAGGKINKHTTLDVDFRNTDLKEALRVIGDSQNLSYVIDDRNISLKPKTPSFLDRVVGAFANIDVQGMVVDEKGQPLKGATVTIKGAIRGTRTGEDGTFLLKNVDEDATIVVSYVGYVLQEFKAIKNLGTIKLELSNQKLEEVLVQTGYQTLKPNEVTGSVVTISREQIERGVSTGILDRLEGIASGLVINKSNGLTATTLSNIQIRGNSTIGGNKLPLIVLDNFPYEGNIDNINPNDECAVGTPTNPTLPNEVIYQN